MTASMDTPALKKGRGAFFTPPDLAAFVAEWAIRTPTDRVLEPSCGEAAFLIAAGERLRALDGNGRIGELHGVELHEPSAKAAEESIAAHGFEAVIDVGDFFEATPPGPFDVVVGNPPYVRYQGFVGDARDRAQRAALAQGVRLGGLASSWAAFVIQAASFLARGGRLGLVLPAELLSVNYAGPVRRFLLDRFRRVRIVLFEDRVFPGVLEEVVLLLAEGEGPTDHVEVSEAREVAGLRELEVRRFFPGGNGAKWTCALVPPEGADALTLLATIGAFTTLRDWGDPDLGMVTGANHFFTLSASEAAARGLKEGELLRISPPGSRHLRNLALTMSMWSRLARDGRAVYLFYPGDRPSDAALRYIREGEGRGVDKAYKCRVRSPWWRVPIVPRADLFFTYMNHVTPQLASNNAAVLHVNSIHGLRLRAGRRAVGCSLLPMAALSSATILGAEVNGRAYGGGILKMEPKEADLLPVPSVDTLRTAAGPLRAARRQVEGLLSEGRVDAAAEAVDQVLLEGALGLDREAVTALRNARRAMFARRAGRGGKVLS